MLIGIYGLDKLFTNSKPTDHVFPLRFTPILLNQRHYGIILEIFNGKSKANLHIDHSISDKI